MPFKIGQKVFCINADAARCDGRRELVRGSTYTVRWVGHATHLIHGTYLGVRLEEIYRSENGGRWPQYPDMTDTPFCVGRFRPVVKRETNISIFREMLTNCKRENVMGYDGELTGG